jgi:hypothetical protein
MVFQMLLASVTKTFTIKDVQTIHRSTPLCFIQTRYDLQSASRFNYYSRIFAMDRRKCGRMSNLAASYTHLFFNNTCQSVLFSSQIDHSEENQILSTSFRSADSVDLANASTLLASWVLLRSSTLSGEEEITSSYRNSLCMQLLTNIFLLKQVSKCRPCGLFLAI